MEDHITAQAGACLPPPPFEYPKQSIISYAQTGEDVLLWRALHSVQGGFYIDIGAHDPTDLSVTRAFYDKGWRGINVEPSPHYAKKLRKDRSRDVTLEVALGSRPGTATLYDFGATGLSTMVKEIADGHMATGLEGAAREISVTTLEALLDDLGDQQVHFLKIDVEGYELPLFRGANFSKVRPWIVLVEAVAPGTTKSTHESWEPLLLNSGYEFAFFDGLNRYYVANEHPELLRYFSVPVNVCDPFRRYEAVQLSNALQERSRDNEFQSNEIGRLSAAISELRQTLSRHETPRLGANSKTPIAHDATDADGLLSIVEAQASDLVRLRRALVAAKSLAAKRLDLILREERYAPNADKMISEWYRSMLIEEIERTRASIAEVVEKSRWRRIGQKLGLAKRLAWEADEATQINNTPFAESRAISEAGAKGKPMAELLSEFERLAAQLDELRRSRWRKLGHLLGLAKRLPWETGDWSHTFLRRPPPSASTPSRPAEFGSQRASEAPVPSLLEYADGRFLEACRSFAIDVILDIGANTGQFAQRIRNSGYQGHIISFEPLTSAHMTLVDNASSDPLWDIAERCAVGASEGWSEINIAGNSYSSSLLPMLDSHRDAAPESVYTGTETCPLITLDGYIERTFSESTTLLGLKIDTQGYEGEVLAGLSRNHNRVKVIICEMSLTPLYSDGIGMFELCRQLAALEYQCIALGPGYQDPRTGELLQVDGVFVKKG